MLQTIISNPLINLSFLAWFCAQLIKTALNWMSTRQLHMERFVGAGGMPSSHSALVCSLAVGMAKVNGFSSPEFALALAFAAVVLYDAMGVRRAAGEHAKMLNQMMFDFKDMGDALMSLFSSSEYSSRPLWDREGEGPPPEAEEEGKRLKEYLGHTPAEVMAGAVLGICIALLYPVA